MRPVRRRDALLQAASLGLLAPYLPGCAADPATAGASPPRDDRLLSLVRVMPGGFLAAPSPGVGIPARPGTGMFVKWAAPTAVAVRGQDLLVQDVAMGRLWRADTVLNTVTPIAGAPTGERVALGLASDLSAWVLDGGARQVLRFGRDGRLLQTFRVDPTSAGPAAMALADAGLTLLVADGAAAMWSEQRGGIGPLQRIAPVLDSGQRITGVDGLAVGRSGVWVLDRAAGVVHRATREGRILESRGRGVLRQPQAIAVDRHDRVWVHEANDPGLGGLSGSEPALRLSNADLGVQQLGGFAIDDDLLAVSDRLVGQVLVHRLGRPRAEAK